MLHPIMSDYKRMLSLAYIDSKDEFHKVPLCVVEDFDMEREFLKDFDSHGILYNKIMTENSVTPSAVKNLRIVGESIRCIKSYTSWI
jgi:hypothetical protein